MSAETDLLNDALGQIGAARISGIDENSVNAHWCKTFYPMLRRNSLRLHFWNFAEERVELGQDAIPPVFGWTYAYGLPGDYLRLREFNGTSIIYYSDPNNLIRYEEAYKIEGSRLLTNSGRALIVYTKDVTNPAEWDALFYEYISTMLASKLAMAIGKDGSKSAFLAQQALQVKLPFSMAVDGQESPTTRMRSDELIKGRW